MTRTLLGTRFVVLSKALITAAATASVRRQTSVSVLYWPGERDAVRSVRNVTARRTFISACRRRNALRPPRFHLSVALFLSYFCSRVRNDVCRFIGCARDRAATRIHSFVPLKPIRKSSELSRGRYTFRCRPSVRIVFFFFYSPNISRRRV